MRRKVAGPMAVRTSLTWEDQFRAWSLARHVGSPPDRILDDTRRGMRGGGPLDTGDGWEWLGRAASDPARIRFLAAVCVRQHVSKRLAYVMARASVYEPDPSSDRRLVEPAVRTLGAVRVYEVLLRFLREGSDAEKAGAASASYWVRGPDDAQHRSARLAFGMALLREFVANEDVDVRRRILPRLALQGIVDGDGAGRLAERAIAIARAHPDEYIRHRVEVQLGAVAPLRPIPDGFPEA